MPSQSCPACEHKEYLSGLELTVEGLMELADSQPVTPDTCSDEQYQSRLAICNACPQLLGGMTCSGCGCFVHLRAKNKSGHCAFGKW